MLNHPSVRPLAAETGENPARSAGRFQLRGKAKEGEREGSKSVLGRTTDDDGG